MSPPPTCEIGVSGYIQRQCVIRPEPDRDFCTIVHAVAVSVGIEVVARDLLDHEPYVGQEIIPQFLDQRCNAGDVHTEIAVFLHTCEVQWLALLSMRGNKYESAAG
jgi:hypothetical protein